MKNRLGRLKMRKNCMFSVFIAAAVAAAVLVASPATWAQSPNEQLIQLVEKLQASPDDDALREQIIKLARKVKPVPAIPEEARQHFVEGIAIAQSAKDAENQKLAVSSFKEALKIAPWWSDAYYNLAVAQELAGELDDAQSSLKLYILTNPGETEARDAQDRIYALNGKKKIAQAEKVVQENADQEAAARAEEDLRWNGQWEQERAWYQPQKSMITTNVESRKTGNLIEFVYPGDGTVVLRGIVSSSGRIAWEENPDPECGWFPISVNVSADQNTVQYETVGFFVRPCRYESGTRRVITFTRRSL